MNNAQLLIPQELTIGFQNRKDTYTGKLGYVIYKDAKGVLRKQHSWEGWRDKSIEPVHCKNEPTEGFVLNRDVGGGRAYHGWDARLEKVRVYDPRGWEFEISIPNLLNIMRDCACSPGKGIEGKLVYSWSGATGPVLLPVNSQDYKNSTTFSELQGLGVKARQMVPGRTYRTKRQEDWVYLGKFDYFYSLGDTSRKNKPTDTGVTKKRVFAKLEKGKWDVVYRNDTKDIAQEASPVAPDNFAELVDLHTKSARGSKITKLVVRPQGEVKARAHGTHDWFAELEPGVFVLLRAHYNHEAKLIKITSACEMSVRDGTLSVAGHYYRDALFAYHPDYREKRDSLFYRQEKEYKPTSPHPWREPVNDQLFAVLECGVEVPIGPYSLTKD